MTLHWPSLTRELVFVDTTGSSDYRSATAVAVARWEASRQVYGAILSRALSSTSERAIPVAVDTALATAGQARLVVEGDLVLRAEIAVRGDIMGDEARLALMVHLVGHALGLLHAEEGCMAAGAPSELLDEGALEMVREAYSSIDPVTPALPASPTWTVFACGRT